MTIIILILTVGLVGLGGYAWTLRRQIDLLHAAASRAYERDMHISDEVAALQRQIVVLRSREGRP